MHGGYPAALKLVGVDVADVTILNNDITAGGGSRTIVCMEEYEIPPSSFRPVRLTGISGNRCTMGGIFAGLLGGWAGLLPFYGPGSMNDAIVTDNTFRGSAAFGVAMLDFKVPSAPANNLVNTGHVDVLANNNFSTFSPPPGQPLSRTIDLQQRLRRAAARSGRRSRQAQCDHPPLSTSTGREDPGE